MVGVLLRLPEGDGFNPVAREVVKWKGTHGAFYADPVEREAPPLPGARRVFSCALTNLLVSALMSVSLAVLAAFFLMLLCCLSFSSLC